MRVHEIRGGERLAPLKHAAPEVPHVVIETNTSCNVRCRSCYAADKPMVKPLAQVKAEVDAALALRRLETVSLLGGEPTLHPDLPEIVRHVKARGLVCIVATNGVRFLHGDTGLLDALVAAGVDRFLLHVDSGQPHLDGDVEGARQRLFDLLDRRRVLYGLSLTLCSGEEGELARVAKAYAPHRWFDGALATLAFDFERAFDPPEVRGPEADLWSVYRSLAQDLGVEPSAYVPSSEDDAEVRWLMYFYFVNATTGEACGLSPRANRWMRAVYRRRTGREFFAATMSPRWTAATAVAAGALESTLDPTSADRWARVLRGGRGLRDLRMQYLVIQRAPRWNPERRAMEICWQCPDATLRQGRLVPVCMAGRLAPLDGSPPGAPDEAFRSVLDHLNPARA